MDDKTLILGTIERAPSFSGLPEGLCAEMANTSRLGRFSDGTLLRSAGNPVTSLMLVVTGALEYSRTQLDGKRLTVRYHTSGVVGDIIPVLDGKGCVFDVRARGDTCLVLIPADSFQNLLHREPTLLYRIAMLLCERSRFSYDLVEQQVTLSLRGRIAHSLLELASSCGRNSGDRIEIGMKVSQDDLSSMLCASRQRVNEQLRWFVREGILSTRYSHITILDTARLTAIAYAPTAGGGPPSLRQLDSGCPDDLRPSFLVGLQERLEAVR